MLFKRIGSILSRLFFIIFINDIADEVDVNKFMLSIDDLKLFAEINSVNDCIRLQQLETAGVTQIA